MSPSPLHRFVTAVQPPISTFVGTLLWQPDRQRARTPWRILVPLLPAVVLPRTVAPLFLDLVPVPLVFFLVNLVGLVVILVFVWASTRFLDRRRSIWEYGIGLDRRWGYDFLAGVIVGTLGITSVVTVGIILGWFDVVGVINRGVMAFWPGLGAVILAYLCVGVGEELLYRGVVLSNTIEGLCGSVPPGWALGGGVTASALIFAAPHVFQPSRPVYLVTWVLGGVMFGVVYLLSGNLAVPMGVHAAVNFGFSGLFLRTDLAASDYLSAVVLIEPAVQSPLFDYGGVIEGGGFMMTGLFAVVWLWYSRDGGLTPWNHPAIHQSETGE